MSWFAQNLFTKWFTQYHKTEDSYKDLNDKGLLERYVQTIGQEIDTNILPYLENLQDNILNPKSIFAKLLPFREQELGVNLVYDDTVERRKQILSYWLRLVQIKGTKRGYEVCIRLMNFSGLIIDTVDVITYFDNPLPSAGCNACYEYDVIVKGNKQVIDLTIVDAFFNLIEWNEPINCKLRFFIYNDTYVPKKLVQFFFKGFDDEKLYVDIKRNPFFNAKLDTLLDNQGNLLIEDEFAEFYQYDSELWDNQGFMLYSQPTPDAYLPFESLTVTEVTQTSASANWESEPDALFYVLNVGLNLLEYGNEIVSNKIIDNLNVGLVTSYDLTNLTANTPYYVQIKAVRADNKQALSHPQAFITMVNVSTPIALPASNITPLNFVANWIALAGINGYELQISTTISFDNIIETIEVIGNFNNVLVELPTNVAYYWRVRAYKDRQGILPIVKSYSDWSNAITFLQGVALRYDGVNDYVDCGDDFNLISNITLDITCKSYKNSDNLKSIISKELQFGLFDFGGTLRIYDWESVLLTNTNISLSTEKRITAVFDSIDTISGSCTVYEYGNFVISFPYKLKSITLNKVLIGLNGDVVSNQFFEGHISDVRIWNRSLTNLEVLNPEIVTNGLIRHFNFNSNEGTILFDSSPNELHGNLINFANTDRGVGNAWIDENGNSVL
jgi:hypothetical protein